MNNNDDGMWALFMLAIFIATFGSYLVCVYIDFSGTIFTFTPLVMWVLYYIGGFKQIANGGVS